MNSYVNSFLKLKCAGDVLNVVGPMNNAEKEISESIAIIKLLRPYALKNKMKFFVVDLCAGNALTSILAVHLLPVAGAFAFDKKKRSGHYDEVKRFNYHRMDISECRLQEKDIVISVHPCKTANLIIDLWNNSESPILIMMPCCKASYPDMPAFLWLETKMSKYDVWTYYLSQKIRNAKVKIITDGEVISPCRNIIYAKRRNSYE